MKNIKVNWDEIFYQHWTHKEKKWTFLILHWWWWSSQSWQKVAKLLNQEWYEVYVPDLPGFGKSVMNRVYSVEEYAKTIENFVKELKLENIILLGHSNWWRISIELENRWKISISKLFLNNSAWIKHKPTFKQKIARTLAKIFKKLNKFPGYSFFRKILYKVVGWHDYLNLENEKMKKTFWNMINSDLSEKMTQVKTKTFIIWWDKDTYTPISDWKQTHHLIKNSEFVILKWEKHGIHLQNPQILFKTLKNFL